MLLICCTFWCGENCEVCQVSRNVHEIGVSLFFRHAVVVGVPDNLDVSSESSQSWIYDTRRKDTFSVDSFDCKCRRESEIGRVAFHGVEKEVIITSLSVNGSFAVYDANDPFAKGENFLATLPSAQNLMSSRRYVDQNDNAFGFMIWRWHRLH